MHNKSGGDKSFVCTLSDVTRKMAHFNPQALILLGLLIVISECTGGSAVNDTVFASPDDNVVLPCFNTNTMDPKSCYRVKWRKHATNSSQTSDILSWPKASNRQVAKWKAAANGQSLFLTKFQKSDEGLYICEVWQGWDRILIKKINLKFKECKFFQVVKVAPGTPVNLTCPVDITSGQQGPQNISWATVKGGSPESVNSEWVQMNGTLLAIQSVKYSDSGWYRCTYMLGQKQHCFEINLQVREEENTVVTTTVSGSLSSSNISSETNKEGAGIRAFTGVLASVTVGIVIIAVLIGLFIYSRLHAQRVTQRPQRLPAGTVGGYEVVNLTHSDDPTNRDNSLYQEIAVEGFCTFHY